MKIPLWKKWLSHLVEVHLESTHSDHNDSLHVTLNKGRLQLSTDNAIYSFADKYENFYKAFEIIGLDDHIEEVLILGFGLGSIPFMLETKFGKDYSYTGVELDEEVIYLASKYVLKDLKSDISMIEADAYNFVHQNNMQYDLICIDIFVDDVIPEVFREAEFLQIISESLTTSGIVLFNHLANTKADVDLAQQYFDQVFIKEFPNGRLLQILGNAMMVNC